MLEKAVLNEVEPFLGFQKIDQRSTFSRILHGPAQFGSYQTDLNEVEHILELFFLRNRFLALTRPFVSLSAPFIAVPQD